MKDNSIDSKEMPPAYIRANFELEDRLAVVLLAKRTGAVIQRLASAEKIAERDFQGWLRHKNAERFEIYLSMNALRDDAKGRTKEDVNIIRHVYLDFDENGTAAIQRLQKREDVPTPNYLVNTSPDKWQAVWKVKDFTKERAEELQRGLARETEADPAATDCSRVLRLPGFHNHKYGRPHLIRAESLSSETYGPERFPKFPADERGRYIRGSSNTHPSPVPAPKSQSERDWAFAKRALSRGESEERIVTVIAGYRQFEKSNPQYYAELTVRKAAESLRAEIPRSGSQINEPER